METWVEKVQHLICQMKMFRNLLPDTTKKGFVSRQSNRKVQSPTL